MKSREDYLKDVKRIMEKVIEDYREKIKMEENNEK